MIGARVVKTCLAVTISILIAKSLNLYAYQFAGIVAVLSVQPSLYRSLRNGIQQTASAVLGAVFGAIALFAVGGSYLSMGFTAFLLMIFHVRIKWTNTLLVSVVIAINTMGTIGLQFWEAAFNQVALVIIGTGIGTLINLIHKPIHQERAEVILCQAEGMLRALLHFLLIDLEKKQITPYSHMKVQIDEIRTFIKKGKEVSGFVIEDRKFCKKPFKNTLNIFQSFELMLERIHEMTKVLASGDFVEEEVKFSRKLLGLIIKVQEKVLSGKTVNLHLFKQVLNQKRNQMWKGAHDSEGFYNFYGYLNDYLNELERFLMENIVLFKKRLTYTSIDRPGLIAEISAILLKHDYNITNVSIQVNGKFATTTMEISAEVDVGHNEIIKDLLELDHVLSADLV